MSAGFGSPQFPIFYLSGSGPTPPGIPTIAADVTLNVPADYPTINDALNFVRGAVRLNGAIVTIAVNGAIYTPNEQLFIDTEDLSYVNVSFTAPTLIDRAGFTPNPLFGAPFFITIQNGAKLGTVSGSFSLAVPGPCAGVGVISGQVDLSGATIGSFAYGILGGGPSNITGLLPISINNSLSSAILLTVGAKMYVQTLNFNHTSAIGVSVQNDAQFYAFAGVWNTTTGILIDAENGEARTTQVTATCGNSVSAIRSRRGANVVFGGALTADCTSELLNVNSGGRLVFDAASLTLTGTNNPAFLGSFNGTTSIPNGPAITGTSTGRVTNTGGGALTQFAYHSIYAAAFSGGDSPSLNTPSNSGLTLG